MSLEIVPVSFRDACLFVASHHRHYRAPVGHKFSIGAASEGVLVGVAIIGRPVARMAQDGWTLEVVRVATDGSRNACSALYGAAWRAAKALGYRRLITYTQESESGASLRGAGWRVVASRRGSSWNRAARPRRPTGAEGVQLLLWEAA